jgi:hypothetical protein
VRARDVGLLSGGGVSARSGGVPTRSGSGGDIRGSGMGKRRVVGGSGDGGSEGVPCVVEEGSVFFPYQGMDERCCVDGRPLGVGLLHHNGVVSWWVVEGESVLRRRVHLTVEWVHHVERSSVGGWQVLCRVCPGDLSSVSHLSNPWVTWDRDGDLAGDRDEDLAGDRRGGGVSKAWHGKSIHCGWGVVV